MTFSRFRLIACIGATFLLGTPVFAQETFPTLADQPTPSYSVENFGVPQGATPPTGLRTLHKTALALIKTFEGWFADLYNDPAEYCTIGYGHLLAKRPCRASDRQTFPRALTRAEGLVLLEDDTAGTRVDVSDLVTATVLSDEQFGALTSFVFNVGRGNFEKSTLLRRLNDTTIPEATRIELAAMEFPRWIRAGGEVMGGLIARRNCEVALFLHLKVTDSSGNFNRELCETRGAMPPVGDTIDIVTGE